MVDFRKKLQEQREQAAAEKATTSKPVKTKAKRSLPEEYVAPDELSNFSVPYKVQLELSKLMEEHLEITQQQHAFKVRKDALSNQIKELCILYSLERFQTDGIQTTVYETHRQTIDKGLLLAAGVSPVQIIKSIKTSDSVSVRVSAVNENKGEDYDYDEN